MAFSKPSSMAVAFSAFLFFFFVVRSSALDMSIVSYDEKSSSSSWSRSEEEVKNLYESWLVKHGKAYNALGEKEKRFEIFKDNLRFIDEHNAGNHTFTLGLNKFADLTNEEYQKRYLGVRSDPRRRIARPKSNRYALRAGEELPESVDWRKKGAVTAIKDQGSCGEFFLEVFSILEPLDRTEIDSGILRTIIHGLDLRIS